MAGLVHVYPQAGDELRRGNTYHIQWRPIGTIDDEVKIELYESTTSTLITTITSGTEDAGIFIWNIPGSQALRDDYYIKITTLDAAYTVSGSDFEIKETRKIEDFTDILNFKKLVVLEWNVGLNLTSDSDWTLYSGTCYKFDAASTEKEISAVTADGVELQKCYSRDYCAANTGTFWHRMFDGAIFINTGSNPTTDPAYILAAVPHGFTNRQDQGSPVTFKIQGTIDESYYMPLLERGSIPSISQRVAEYYTGAMTTQFGTVRFLNNGIWWENRETYIWHNRKVTLKVGEIGDAYDELVTVFPGVSKQPIFSDQGMTVQIKDRRTADLTTIPTARFDTTTYANLDPEEENKPIPILFGIKTGIRATLVNSSTHIYKISDTVFNGITYALQSIDAVYQAGVEIYETTNWTKNLNTGEITLVNDPGNDEITVDAHGVKCQYNFTTGLPTSTFSENVADILFFILTELNGISVSNINLEEFGDLQTQRTQRIGLYMATAKATMEWVRSLQTSSVYHFIPQLDGNYTVRYYDRTTPADSPHFYNEDYGKRSFKITELTDSTFTAVNLRYDKDPSQDLWKEIYVEIDGVEEIYGEREVLQIDTLLTVESEAQNLAEFYAEMIQEPPKIIEAKVPGTALQNIPTDKGFFTRSIIDDRGTKIQIVEEEVYLLLEVRKNLATAEVTIKGILDTQVGGSGSHADVAHIDSHTDTSHSDHSDEAYGDTPYSDIPAYDDHTNTPYVDEYSDIAHADDYTDHSDTFHIDIHADITHTDSHTNTPYDDSYTDTPHTDTVHVDSHIDSHSNTHNDEHGDIPHTDSWI